RTNGGVLSRYPGIAVDRRGGGWLHLSIRTQPALGRSGAKLKSARHLAGVRNKLHRSCCFVFKSEWNSASRRSGTITGRFRWFFHLRAKRSDPSRDRPRRGVKGLL